MSDAGAAGQWRLPEPSAITRLGLRRWRLGSPLPGGSLPPPPLEPTLEVISVGEEVTGTLQPCCVWGPAVFEMLFELTAPSDGYVGRSPSVRALCLYEDVYRWPMWRSPRIHSTIAS